MMKYSELTQKSLAELTTALVAARKDLQTVEFAVASGQEKHVRKIRQLKQYVAKILTALNSKDDHGQAN